MAQISETLTRERLYSNLQISSKSLANNVLIKIVIDSPPLTGKIKQIAFNRFLYTKHGLSRGGSLQVSLTGLQHKGLIYSAEQGYQLALPLLALWLRQRLS